MSPRVIAILVVILLVIFGGMALTMKRATKKNSERMGAGETKTYQVRFLRSGGPERGNVPGPFSAGGHSMRRCFIA